MKNRQNISAKDLSQRVSQELLPFVEQPGQYIGGEINQTKKDLTACDVKIALAFPDTYSVGMSHLGLAILYEVVNAMEGVAAERVYCPQRDAERVMREKGIELFSWESRAAVRSFDILGFSLQYELCGTNVLTMLDLAGIKLLAEERGEDEPLVIGGGAIAETPEPLADFFDAFIVGDSEEALPAFICSFREFRSSGLTRAEILRELALRFDWLYVPSLYEVEYSAAGSISRFQPRFAGVRPTLTRTHVNDMENCPAVSRPLLAHTSIVHERVAVEIMRGCPNSCRFCQASYTRRPVRYRSVEKVLALARQALRATGYDEISLLSLSTSDYPKLPELIQRLNQEFAEAGINVSLPSLRVGETLRLLPKQISVVRKSGLTIALESANQQTRLLMNKCISDSDLLAGVREAYRVGWRQIKLYFMVGFENEQPEDIQAIYELAVQLSELRREVAKGPGTVNVAISWVIPKPHTPLAWSAQKPAEYFHRVRKILRQVQSKRHPTVQIKFHNVERSVLEAVLARGDRRLGRVIRNAWHNGARFDAWDEQFNPGLWQQAFNAEGLEVSFYANRLRSYDEILPWDHIQAGTAREILVEQAKTLEQSLASPRH